MPYIAIKAYPKDENIKKKVAERVKQVFLEEWGCPAEAICISFEEVAPADWQAKVVEPEIKPQEDIMYVLNGKATK